MRPQAQVFAEHQGQGDQHEHDDEQGQAGGHERHVVGAQHGRVVERPVDAGPGVALRLALVDGRGHRRRLVRAQHRRRRVIVVLQPPLEPDDHVAVAQPRVAGQRDGRQRVGRVQLLPRPELVDLIVLQVQHLQRLERSERPVRNARDPVVVQVQFGELGQRLELAAVEPVQLVVLDVQHPQVGHPVERLVVQRHHVAVVHVQHLQFLFAEENVAGQLAQIVAVQVYLGRVHRDPGRDGLVPGVRAVHYVGRPNVVVVTRAVVGARHLAVASVVFTAFAHGKTMGLVLAQKLRRPGGQDGHHLRASGICCFAHYVVEVHDFRVLPQLRHIVDSGQPVHGTVALKRIATDVEFRQRTVDRHNAQPQGVHVQSRQFVGVQVHAHQISLFQKRVGSDVRKEIVVEE